MPFFDQSVAKHVGFVLSKILTPLWISSIMVNFDLSKACCRSSSLLSSSRKGSIVSVTYDDQTKPSICDSWEVGDSPDILLAWSHCVCRDFEASEFNLVLGKPKFLGVEGDA